MVCNQKIPQMINLMVCVLIPSEIYVGLEKTVQYIHESTKSLKVCVILFDSPTVSYISSRSCPVEFSVTVNIITTPDSAGSKVQMVL